MSDSTYRNHRSRERDYRSQDRHYRDHDGHHASDYSSNRRVPGRVSDPDAHRGEANYAIHKGQRETVDRYQRDRFSPTKDSSSKVTKDTLSSPKRYEQSVLTVSQPYYPTKTNPYYNTSARPRRRLPINPGFLAFLPGLMALALLIAAIVMVAWEVRLNNSNTSISTSTFRVINKGLFQVCTYDTNAGSSTPSTCETLESFASSGTVISDLEQATRGMIIIAAILSFASLIVSVFFGCNRWQRRRGVLISGGAFAFAGACAVAAMGCYSGVLVNSQSSSTDVSQVFAGTSFYLGWMGAACLILASITSFLAHCARHK